MIDATSAGSGGGSSLIVGSPVMPNETFETPKNVPIFTQERCLFCNKTLESFTSNVAHMQSAHSLFIPDKERLLVDLETLFAYLHLVIFGYHECICCGTQRNTTLAVQQHMLGKGHCRFNISQEDSEFADFYDSSSSEAGNGEEEDEDEDENDDAYHDSDDAPRKPAMGKSELSIEPDENSLRLPSGRIISHRSSSQPHIRRQLLRSTTAARPTDDTDLLEDEQASSNTPINRDFHLQQSSLSSFPSSSSPSSPSTALAARSSGRTSGLTKSERKEMKLPRHMASLRTSDERSLAHLSLPEQRAVVSTQMRQVDKAKRVEEKYRNRVEGLGNQFLMTHFRKDAADKRTLFR